MYGVFGSMENFEKEINTFLNTDIIRLKKKMPKLNQIVAVATGVKTEMKREITDLHRKTGVVDLFSGLSRTYQPLDDDGEQLPSEGKVVQVNCDQVLEEAADIWKNGWDVVATQDHNNCKTNVNVVVDGKVVVENVPVTYLMFLEKQLQDVEKFVNSLPVLDPSINWEYDENQGFFKSEPSLSVRTKKVPKHKVLYEATKEHPAQIEKWTEDVPVGTWTAVRFSGAIPMKEKREILERVRKLQTAVKFAREEANSAEVEDKKVAAEIFKYLF